MAHDPSALTPGGEFDLTIEVVRYRSPLSLDAISRIFEAPGQSLDLHPREMEAARLTLMKLTDLAMSRLMFPLPPAPAAKVKRAKGRFVEFLHLVTEIGNANNAPPPLPEDYWNQMMGWLRTPTPAIRGAPKRAAENDLYGNLLAFYAALYGREPAGTAGGPTVRFLAAFDMEFRAALAGLTFPNDPERQPPVWPQQTPTSLQLKIRRGKDASVANTWPDDLFRLFLSRLPAGEADPPAPRPH